ncbi:MAG: flagellar M-ring protein FliF [Lachnospiraceae bacterium]|nr:flagellar M-ring protein FliF [Lachnospiraceae bacterium]
MFEKLIDKLKEIPPKFLEWWNKFTKNQKALIISVAIGVIIAFGILIFVVTRTQYVNIITCENATQASQVKELLESNEIAYKVSDSGLVFSVDKTKLSEANIVLGSNNILTDSYSNLDNVLGTSLSTTEADKQKKYTAYKENKLKKDLESFSFVESASVNMYVPENDGTLISNNKESSVQITLRLSGECSVDNAAAIARMAKTVVGNETTDNVVIIDTDGNLLYSGGDDNTLAGYASNTLNLKQEAERVVRNDVQSVLLGTNEFDYVVVSPNLTLDLSSKEVQKTTYTPADGQTQGLLSHETNYEAESEGGTALVPGTDSNVEQDTTYVYENGGGNSSTVTQYEKDYLPNTETEIQSIPAGGIVYKDSSIAVTAIRLKVIKEEDAKAQGLLDEISWDEYKLENSARNKIDIDNDYYELISDASGISTEDITIVAYEEPFFVDKTVASLNWTKIIQIALIVIILLLLGMVILRTLKTEKNKDEEPEEISVEKLLQTVPDEQLEDIDLESKSETRRMIEKFVDENPEAVANLLRNWLSEDWG